MTSDVHQSAPHRFRRRVKYAVMLCAIGLCGLGLTAPAWASDAAPTQSPTPAPKQTLPTDVYVGLYPLDVYDLDLHKGSYTIDCYIWLRWKGEIDPTQFEFMNGSMDLKEHPDNKEADGVKYVSYHCRGNFHARFDYRKYPLDSHQLVAYVEDADHDVLELKYVADLANLQRPPSVNLTGWNCGLPVFGTHEIVYETNYGNRTRSSDATAVYSRFVMTINVNHAGIAIYLKTFLGLFISVAIAFLAFIIEPLDLDPRFGVGIAAIFGAVSSEIVTSGNLPDMPYLTLADKIHVVSFFFIFLSLLQSCIALKLVHANRQTASKSLDRKSALLFPVFYGLTVAAITLASMWA